MKHLSIPVVIAGFFIFIGISPTAVGATGQSDSSSKSPTIPLCKSSYKRKAVPAKTLQDLMHSHERWVENRSNQDAKRMELCQADLSGAALMGANLERADLEGTILRQAKLSQTTLSQASLAGADLTKAILKDSIISGADLRRARLTGAILSCRRR